MEVKQVLSRFYVNDMNHAIAFYEKIFKQGCDSRFSYPQAGLEIAQVGNVLIIAGSDEALKSFRSTQATLLVDSVIEFKKFLLQEGAVMIRDIQAVPTGFNMTVKHPDGTIIEYVEHTKSL